MKKTLLIFLVLINNIGLASYVENRHRADFDPATVAARAKFKKKMDLTFELLKSRRETNASLRLKLNLRLVSQFGRGLESALVILPLQLTTIVNAIEDSIANPSAVYEMVKNEQVLELELEESIKNAIYSLSQTKIIKMSYWGYLSRNETLPNFNLNNNQLTYFSKWNEGQDTYAIVSNAQIISKIVLGIIKDSQKEWYEFW